MAIPSPVKFKRKQGKSVVEYVSRIDRTKYMMNELNRSALKAVGRYLRNRMLDKVRKLRGMKRSKKPVKAYSFWVRKRDGDLWIGVKHNTWYGAWQEFGA